MAIDDRPAFVFDHVARIVGPKRPDANVCWCLSYRIPSKENLLEGVSHALLAGAVEFARSHGAPAIEGYPVDNGGKKVDLTMAYVGTRALFEKAGFHKAADTSSVLGGFPRVLMRLDLR